MKTPTTLDPRHDSVRALLRVVGPLVALAGLVFTAIGFISFFSSFGTFQPPKYFWCAVLGLPLLGVGLAISKFAFMGAFFRYFAGEVAPVQKDTFNYFAEGTAPGVETLAQAAGRGFTAGTAGAQAATVACLKCHAAIPAGSRYCNHCGAPLGETP